MPDDDHRSTSLPPQGASAEEMLRTVLPMVARSAAESAKAATLSATSISGFQGEISALKSEIALLRTSVDGTVKVIVRDQSEKNRWIRRIITPELVAQIVLNLMMLIGGLLGVYTFLPHTERSLVEASDGSP